MLFGEWGGIRFMHVVTGHPVYKLMMMMGEFFLVLRYNLAAYLRLFINNYLNKNMKIIFI